MRDEAAAAPLRARDQPAQQPSVVGRPGAEHLQPGVSRQIQLLEAELGFEIFRRTRNRIIGLTEPGQQVLEIARRVITDVSALRSLKEEMYSGIAGR